MQLSGHLLLTSKVLMSASDRLGSQFTEICAKINLYYPMLASPPQLHLRSLEASNLIKQASNLDLSSAHFSAGFACLWESIFHCWLDRRAQVVCDGWREALSQSSLASLTDDHLLFSLVSNRTDSWEEWFLSLADIRNFINHFREPSFPLQAVLSFFFKFFPEARSSYVVLG